MVDKRLIEFIRAKRINSIQKLRVLLFLGQSNYSVISAQQLAEHVYFEVPLIETIIHELNLVGILIKKEDEYILPNEPALKTLLTELIQTFQYPLARQELLGYVKKESP